VSAETVEVACVRRPSSTWTKCGCPTCRPEQLRLDKHRKVIGYTRAPSELAWAVIAELADAGWTGAAIADAYNISTNVCQDVVARHLAGGDPWLLANLTSRRLLSPPVRRPRYGFVPVVGSTRRLQALASIGWTYPDVIRLTGITASVLSDVQSMRRPLIAARSASLITDAYDDLSRSMGSSTRARFRARKKGWYAPADWEYADLDDPNSFPEDVKSHHAPQERYEAIRKAHTEGMTVDRIAVKFECSEKTVMRAIKGKAA
jgi:hypothetical protein